MFDSIEVFISLHESALAVVAIAVAVGAGVIGYGRHHERRTRSRGDRLIG